MLKSRKCRGHVFEFLTKNTPSFGEGGGAYADKPEPRGTTFSPLTHAHLDRYPAPFGGAGDYVS